MLKPSQNIVEFKVTRARDIWPLGFKEESLTFSHFFINSQTPF